MELNELHWMLDILQSIDVGVVVLDREYRIEVWNSFMESHSGLEPEEVQGQSVFRIFPEMDEAWFRNKVETVATLGTRTFTIWEQRPYLVRFKNYQPITGQEDFMYQNTTIIPLKGASGKVEHVCVVIYDVTHVASNKKQLQSATAKLHQLTRTDALSGLLNRAYWDKTLEQEFARHQRYQRQLSLLLLDIDQFKAFNAQYEHAAGDLLLRSLADLLGQHVRTLDPCGRYGADQFAVLLPDTAGEGAQQLAERLRDAVSQQVLLHDGQAVRYSVSIGVAELDANCLNPRQFCERAEQALARAKQAGRNCVVAYA